MVDLLLELVARRGDAFALVLPGVVGAVARVLEVLVDGDAVRADLGDGRLGLRSRGPCLRRDARLQPFEVGVPAVELCLDGGDERRPIAGDVRTERVLGNVDPRPQPLELLLDLARSLAGRGAYGRLRIVQCLEMASNPRQTAGLRARLDAVDAPADLGAAGLRRWW